MFILFTSPRRRYKRCRVIVRGIDVQFQADLVYLQNLSRYKKGYKYLLIIKQYTNSNADFGVDAL